MFSFGSDNHNGVHPRYLEAICRANSESQFAPSYGQDPQSKELEHVLKSIFKTKELRALSVFSGTGGNVLALKTLLKSYQSVLCSPVSHVSTDECGAPELLVGSKVIAAPNDTLTESGKLTVSSLQWYWQRLGDQHATQPGVLSLSQPTEHGEVYTLSELQVLVKNAREKNLLVHMDGSRIFQACHTLGCDLHSFTTDLGIDALTISGSKQGFLFGEIVLFFNSKYFEDAKFYRKQLLQTPSKTRFIAAQFLECFRDGLGHEIAKKQSELAIRLREELLEIIKDFPESLEILWKTESNAVFLKMPPWLMKLLRKDFFFYVWDPARHIVRLMTTFDMTELDVERFCKTVRAILRDQPAR